MKSNRCRHRFNLEENWSYIYCFISKQCYSCQEHRKKENRADVKLRTYISRSELKSENRPDNEYGLKDYTREHIKKKRKCQF